MLIYLGIGSNLGDREANLLRAIELLHERVGECLACSSIYKSSPQGFVSNNEFANMVTAHHTSYSPEEVLSITQQIECEMGRTEKSVDGIYHDRVIDIDLLQARDDEANEVIRRSNERLTLPHPRMQERDFVMIPLREIMSAAEH